MISTSESQLLINIYFFYIDLVLLMEDKNVGEEVRRCNCVAKSNVQDREKIPEPSNARDYHIFYPLSLYLDKGVVIVKHGYHTNQNQARKFYSLRLIN